MSRPPINNDLLDEAITLGTSSPDSNDRNYSDDYSVRSVSSDDEGIDFSEPPVTTKASGNGNSVRSKTVAKDYKFFLES
jgi:hypothetical protein